MIGQGILTTRWPYGGCSRLLATKGGHTGLQEFEDLSDDEREAFDAFCEVEGDEDVDTFRERYIGEFSNWADMAEHVVEETALLEGVPESLHATSTTRATGTTCA
ncbi:MULTISPECIES: antirestriction protein ArdA [Xanthomonas]|uniref:antirestriction protein ArdA n=1 Tax=Xanthomonas TaxID=338 RepID=UPI001EDE6C03|nr:MULTISPECIES: antirestriction protein ArdA [Xanthomonas]MEA9589608.1 antirestriction protein ArdA [Xanthomonas sp. WHRI 10064B]MEA9617041.1 antirestriction protein ArdA [Xanthomonas sp. WHRI 10064A]